MSSDTNPLEKDSKLKSLLNDVEAVDSAEGFFQWRTSFLEVYTTYLDTAGSEKAKARYEAFAKTSTGLRKIVKQLEDLLEQGNLAVGSVSVKARMGMSELKVKLGVLIKDIMKLMPATDKEIKECGFTKWHMGAVLVEDGFRIYAVMMSARALLKQLRVAALDDVADRQILDEIEYFGKKFDIFCGVMADLGLMSVCDKATELIYTEMLQEAQKAEESAKTLQREKLSATQHSKNSGGPKKLDVSIFEANKPPKVDKDNRCDTVEESESSYETIEEEITVSSYESVEREDDSSYETVEEIQADSEYETDEEEIEVSDYETDTDSEEDLDDNKKVGGIGKKAKGKDKKKLKAGPGSAGKKPLGKKPASAKANGSSSGKRSAGNSKKSGGASGGAPGDKGEENDESKNDEEEEDEDEDDQADESDSDDSDIPPPVKYGKSKPMPTQPEPKEDVYKPTERMKWKLKDYDPLGNCKRERKSLFPFRRNKKNKQPEPEPEPEPPKEKKYRRFMRTETVKVRRKKEKPPPTKVRVKKQKPPVKVKVRREHKVIQKKRVKKNAAKNTIPTDIIVKKEEPTEPTPLPPPECTPTERVSPKKKKNKSTTRTSADTTESRKVSKSPKKKKRDVKNDEDAETSTLPPPECAPSESALPKKTKKKSTTKTSEKKESGKLSKSPKRRKSLTWFEPTNQEGGHLTRPRVTTHQIT